MWIQLTSHGLERGACAQSLRLHRALGLLAHCLRVLPWVGNTGERAIDQHFVEKSERDKTEIDSHLGTAYIDERATQAAM